jgi:hypothetical protein
MWGGEGPLVQAYRYATLLLATCLWYKSFVELVILTFFFFSIWVKRWQHVADANMNPICFTTSALLDSIIVLDYLTDDGWWMIPAGR